MTTQRKPLGKREITYIKAKVDGKSNTEAAMIATGAKSRDVAKKQGHRLSTNVNVQDALAAAFEAHGITMDAAIAPIGAGLTATKTVIVRDKGATSTDTSDNSAFADEVPDHAIRLKASGMALGLMGLGNKQSGDVTINFINHSNEQRGKYGI